MRFDYTKGQEAHYMVSVYREMTSDHYYIHFYDEALNLFRRLRDSEKERGSSISIYDIKKDVRKAFAKV